jgi:hypothetical protein
MLKITIFTHTSFFENSSSKVPSGMQNCFWLVGGTQIFLGSFGGTRLRRLGTPALDLIKFFPLGWMKIFISMKWVNILNQIYFTWNMGTAGHRCTVVGNPEWGSLGFFGKFFWGGYLGLWENQGGVVFYCIFMWKFFKNLYTGYMRCPPPPSPPPPVCIIGPGKFKFLFIRSFNPQL